MRRNQFTTELKSHLTDKDFLSLRTLYTPVIGKDAVMLYSLLFDYYNLAKDANTFYEFNDLAITLGMTEDALVNERKKLEAVGLIRTFEKADNIHFIIRINQPLAPAQFRNNSLLFKSAVAKIGELMFERIEFSTKTKELAKDEYAEVSTKYQDMFAVVAATKEVNVNTMEIALPTVKSKEEAINGLTSSQFVFFLTGAKVSPSQLANFQQIQNAGLSSKSLNLIIDYSFGINNKIVTNHIRKIADDLLTKDLKDASSIEKELLAAKGSRQASFVVTHNVEPKLEETADLASWDDLFKSLGGAF